MYMHYIIDIHLNVVTWKGEGFLNWNFIHLILVLHNLKKGFSHFYFQNLKSVTNMIDIHLHDATICY